MQTQPTYLQGEKSQPLVSFIVPVFNVPSAMLRQCVESILRLSLSSQEREIVIVDDGSTAFAINDIKDLSEQIVYVRQPNRGVSVARNLGLSIARGAFIQFIDGDDMLHQSPYEHVLDLIRYAGADMVMFDFATESAADTTGFTDQGPVAGSDLMRKTNIHGSVWGFIFSRSILGTLRFTPGVSYGEDEEFTPQLTIRAEKVVKTNAKAYFYRMRPSSVSNASDMESIKKRLADSKEVIYTLHRKADTMPTDDRIAMQRRVAQLTMDYIYNIIILTQDKHFLDEQLDELRQKGLFPLPDQDYTTKYKWFRRMTSTNIGLLMLMRTLPLMNRER